MSGEAAETEAEEGDGSRYSDGKAEARWSIQNLMLAFGLLTFAITATISRGQHSLIHDVLARIAMLLEGGLIFLALVDTAPPGLCLMLALMIGGCFVAVAITDTDRGEVAIRQWRIQ